MSILLVQIFLLLLGAFLAGAVTAYLFRRAFGARPSAPSSIPSTPPGSGGTHVEHAARFERALTGGHASMVPPPFQRSGAPMIEVQPVVVPTPTAAAPVPLPSSRIAAAVAEAPKPAPPPPPAATPPAPAPVAQPAPPAPEAKPAPPPAAPPEPAKAATPEPPVVSYAAVAAAAAARAAAGPADNLTRIHAIDAETQRRLAGAGVLTFADIAKWSPDDVARVSQALGLGPRIEQENWIGQAQILARGGAPAATPAREPAPTPTPVAGPDRLHRIAGIDAETERLLIENGVTRFADIAAWTSEEIEQVEEFFGAPGRVGLENWIGQAKVLARAAAGNGAAPELPQAASPPPAPQPPQASVSRLPTAAAPAPEPPRARPRPADFQGLRSVRSEALRREPLGATLARFDDLKRIRGVGVLIEKKLNSLGIASYEQIANWTGADIDRVSQILDFKGRIEREGWVEQARILASGGATEFSRRADRGEVESSRPRG